MFPAVKTRPDDTRARIMDTAETLFRSIGFAKTTVADIASELGMSPANVYRFFPSKTAIVQAICQRCLGELEAKIWSVARSRDAASQRLERLTLEVLAYHKENLLTEQKVNDMVLVAMEESWDAIMAHKEVYRNAIELILRDGIESGEFEPVDPRETSATDHAGPGIALPSIAARAGPSGRPQSRERGAGLDPPPAPRHHQAKVTGHDPVPSRIIAPK